MDCFSGSGISKVVVCLIMPYNIFKRKKRGLVMKAVVTRVKEARVEIDGVVKGSIQEGFLVLLGIAPNDETGDVVKLVDKICGCRVFADENKKMNLNLSAIGGTLLVISQFTLFADLKSRRPGFTGAAKPDIAIPLYEKFITECKKRGFLIESGEFGADMQVYSINDGPVTLLFNSKEL